MYKIGCEKTEFKRKKKDYCRKHFLIPTQIQILGLGLPESPTQVQDPPTGTLPCFSFLTLFAMLVIYKAP